MKKIMFNDRYGLTQAVLEGRKTMTRRIAKGKPQYMIGEWVAIAQSYRSLYDEIAKAKGVFDIEDKRWWYDIYLKTNGRRDLLPGYRNKMFVRAEFMRHRVVITGVRLQNLQDISDDDCMREGIMEGEFMNTRDRYYYDSVGDVANHITFPTPRKAYSHLIDKICGKGTWESNPLVFVYEFTLID